MFSGAPRKSDVRSCLEKLCDSKGVKLEMTEIDLQISDDHDMSDEDRCRSWSPKSREGTSISSSCLHRVQHGPEPFGRIELGPSQLGRGNSRLASLGSNRTSRRKRT